MCKRFRVPTIVLFAGWFFFGCAGIIEDPAPATHAGPAFTPAPFSDHGQPGAYCECWGPQGGITCGDPAFPVHHADGSECANQDAQCSGACYVLNQGGELFFESELRVIPIIREPGLK